MDFRLVVLFQTQMPCNAGAGTDGAKLMDDIARDEIYVVVPETELGIANAVSAELVQFSLLDPTT